MTKEQWARLAVYLRDEAKIRLGQTPETLRALANVCQLMANATKD